MAFATRSSVYAFIKEDTEGVLKDPTAASFTSVREGANLIGAVNTTTSDEVRNSIGASKSFVTTQAPTGSIPKYLVTSGEEGVAPEYSILIESALGGLTVNTTEYNTAVGSTAGDADTRAVIAVTPGDEANFAKGQALLIKDGVNNYAVRNIWDGITSGAMPLAFNLDTAPASGVGLGKATFFYPLDVNQPTYSSHRFQASTVGSAIHQAIAGTRTTSMTIDLVTGELGAISFEIGGIQFFTDPITISATNKYIDFTDDSGTVAAILDEDTYATPIDLANEVAAKMTAASAPSGGNDITCTWSNSEGKFTIASDGATLSLLWNTGTNAANEAGTTLGFDASADDTGSLSYEADNAQTYEPSVTPEFDGVDPIIVRDNMLQLGNFDDYVCLGGQNLSISVSTPKTDVPNWCAKTGIDESLTLSREVTISGTIKFAKHDVQRVYNLLNNVSSQLSFVTGLKTGNNWIPGTVSNIFLPQVSFTTDQLDDQDGYIVESIEATAFVGADMQDIYINML